MDAFLISSSRMSCSSSRTPHSRVHRFLLLVRYATTLVPETVMYCSSDRSRSFLQSSKCIFNTEDTALVSPYIVHSFKICTLITSEISSDGNLIFSFSIMNQYSNTEGKSYPKKGTTPSERVNTEKEMHFHRLVGVARRRPNIASYGGGNSRCPTVSLTGDCHPCCSGVSQAL